MVRMTASTIDVVWQHPRGEAAWEPGPAPEAARRLEPVARQALKDAGERVRVLFRADGQRWRVLVEAPDLEPQHSLELTRRVVNALRQAGHQAEPGFPGDPHAPALPVDPVE